MKVLLLSAMLALTFPLIPISNQVTVAQRKQPARKAASGDPNTVIVSFSKIQAKGHDCLIDTWVGYVAAGVHQNFAGWPVTYVLWSGPGPAPQPATTDQNGFILHQAISVNTDIRARVYLSSSNLHIISGEITCLSNGIDTK